MRLGYNTNGFAHHRLTDAVELLAEIGYGGVALTLDHHHLDPFADDWFTATRRLRSRLDALGLHRTIETGARFLLDPHRKHQPTLLSAAPQDRRRRLDFLHRAIDIAAELQAPLVSLWSGAPDDAAGESEWMQRLGHGLCELLEHAARAGVRLAFEPEPGMFVDTMARFAAVEAQLAHASFGLTLDVGHVHCLGDGELRDHVVRWRHKLWNMHIEDMRRGVHEHLMFGEGEIDFAAVFAALRAIDYTGPLNVELSRHSHAAVCAARQAFDFLRAYLVSA